jgi:hypothetical protein
VVTVDADTPCEWVEINGLGQVIGKPFTGTAGDLRAHLLRATPEATVSEPHDVAVYVRAHFDKVPSTEITLSTPWGGQRWIARPPSTVPAPRRHAWLLRR